MTSPSRREQNMSRTDRRTHRPVAAVSVLALVATLLIALPTALPRLAGDVSLAPSADAVPPKPKPLPPCEDDARGDPQPWCARQWTRVSPCPASDGGVACDVPGSDVGIAVDGAIEEGMTYQVTAAPGLPPCGSPDQTGCYEGISSYHISAPCIWWEGDEIKTSPVGCARHMDDVFGFNTAVVTHFEAKAPRRLDGIDSYTEGCGHHFNDTYGHGGGSTWEGDGEGGWVVGEVKTYPELAPLALTCTIRPRVMSWSSDGSSTEEPIDIDQLPGPFWMTAWVSMTERMGPGIPARQHYATAPVPVLGDLKDSGPRARFEYEPGTEGAYDFWSTSYHPAGEGMTYAWRAEWWGPGGAYAEHTATGPTARFTFEELGWWDVVLEVADTDGEKDEYWDAILVEPAIDGEWFRTDLLGSYVKHRAVTDVRLRVENRTRQELSGVDVVATTVTPHPLPADWDPPADDASCPEIPAEDEEALPEPEEPHAAAMLTPLDASALRGTLDATGPGSVDFLDFELEGVEKGDVLLCAEVVAASPTGQLTETIEAVWEVKPQDLDVEITFDPPEHVQVESPDPEEPPEPVEMTATVTITNVSGGRLSDVTVEEFELSRAIGEQELWVEQVGGQRITNWDAPGILLELPVDVDEPLDPFVLEDGEKKVFTADFIVRDDGQLDFHVLALAADDADRTVRGYGENSWVVAPEKYLEVTTEVIMPRQGLLPAGRPVVIKGRVVNLSQTATLEVGPLIPIPTGNTGQVSLVYGGGRAPDPSELPAIPEPLELGPNDSELFEVAIATTQSDPRSNFHTGEPEVARSGGTRASFEFDPWAIATEADGTERIVRTDPRTPEDRGVKIAEEHRKFHVGIDDSIAIPEMDFVMLAGGIGVGVVTGIARAGIGLVVGAVEVLKLPFTLTIGAMEYQSRVWKSFSEEERRLYSEDLGTYLVAMAVGNVENGLKDAGQLRREMDEMVYREMTRLANEWETGDYVSAAQAYAAGGSEIAASLWLPAAMTKLAQTPRAAAAIERAQLAVNARMGPIFAEARAIRYVEEALPLLRALENGAEISADAMRVMYGVTPDEVAELQRLAQKYELLITFRSRHPSSVAWMEKFGAMMKPEAIKIKTVSEMDVRLGYRDGDLGSVVFRKPEVLKTAPGDGVGFVDHVRDFVQSKGFTPGTKDFDSAVDRVKLRVKEWYKHEEAYKTYDRRKWISTEFNYEGNAIRNAVPDSHNRRTGFELEEVGDEEYVVRLMDPKDGKYKRVTGDIDPIAFTNLDGSPLTQSQHRDLINEMRASEKLRAQHPESATFEDGDLDFVEDQFKPGEAAAQLGPEGPARAVRLNKGRSRWSNPRDYHLHWEGGYKHVGGRGKIEQRTEFDPNFGRPSDVEVPEKLEFKPVQLGEAGEAGIGRGTLQAVATGTGTAVFLGEGGDLIEVNPDGTTQPWEGSASILEEGEPITLEIAPAGQVESTVTSDVQGAALRGDQFGWQRSSVAASAAQVDGVVLVDDEAPVLFAPGQVVAVGVQDGQGELRTLASVDGHTVMFTEPVAAAADDIVVMLKPAPAAPGNGSGSPGTTDGDATDGGTDGGDGASEGGPTDGATGDGSRDEDGRDHNAGSPDGDDGDDAPSAGRPEADPTPQPPRRGATTAGDGGTADDDGNGRTADVHSAGSVDDGPAAGDEVSDPAGDDDGTGDVPPSDGTSSAPGAAQPPDSSDGGDGPVAAPPARPADARGWPALIALTAVLIGLAAVPAMRGRGVRRRT